MWSDLTAPFDMNGYLSITGMTWSKFGTSLLSGCGITITNARIWPWADLPQHSGWPWPPNRSYFCALLEMGGLPGGRILRMGHYRDNKKNTDKLFSSAVILRDS